MRDNLGREKLEEGPEETQPRASRRPFATDRSGNRQRETHLTTCREGGTTEQSYYHWREDYGGLKGEQARRLKGLEKENSRLQRVLQYGRYGYRRLTVELARHAVV
jgi:hypothetical protein